MLIQQNSEHKSPAMKLVSAALAVYLAKLASIKEKNRSKVVSLYFKFPHYKMRVVYVSVSFISVHAKQFGST